MSVCEGKKNKPCTSIEKKTKHTAWTRTEEHTNARRCICMNWSQTDKKRDVGVTTVAGWIPFPVNTEWKGDCGFGNLDFPNLLS